MEDTEVRIFFEKERSDLSTRAINLLKELEIYDFRAFMDFIKMNNFTYDFQKVRNCGKRTAIEINGLIITLLSKYHSEREISSQDANTKITEEVEKEEKRIPNITFLYKSKLREFVLEDIETVQLLRYIDEFNYMFCKLSVRSRNIFRFLEIDTFKAMLNFLQTVKIGFRFIKVQNCGKKAEVECDNFIKDVIYLLVKDSEAALKTSSAIQSSLFQILNSYIFESKIFSEREIEILKVRFKINKNAEQNDKGALSEIANKFNLTTERIRQLETTLPRKVKLLTNNVIKEFNLDISKYTSSKFFLIDDQYTEKINEAEQTEFSLSFVILILDSIFNFDFEIFKFKTSDKLFAIAIEKKIRFDFERCFDYLITIVDNPVRKRGIILTLNEINEEYALNLNTPIDIAVRDILYCFLGQWDFVQIDNNQISILRNTRLKLFERIETLLKQNAKPLHYTKIYSLLTEQGIEITNALNVHSVLQRFPDIFGLKGQGIYGLKEWGGYFGSIGDVAEEYLKKRNEPLSMRDLEEFICRELIVSQESIREVLFHYAAENRFIKHRNGKVGLRKWDNVQLKMFK